MTIIIYLRLQHEISSESLAIHLGSDSEDARIGGYS